jgi:hypothetical protein
MKKPGFESVLSGLFRPAQEYELTRNASADEKSEAAFCAASLVDVATKL